MLTHLLFLLLFLFSKQIFFLSYLKFLPVPELMPFRLTKQILNVFLPHQTKGILEGTMTCAINALRSDKELLLLMMDIFIKDPSVDWLVGMQIFFFFFP